MQPRDGLASRPDGPKDGWTDRHTHAHARAHEPAQAHVEPIDFYAHPRRRGRRPPPRLRPPRRCRGALPRARIGHGRAPEAPHRSARAPWGGDLTAEVGPPPPLQVRARPGALPEGAVRLPSCTGRAGANSADGPQMKKGRSTGPIGSEADDARSRTMSRHSHDKHPSHTTLEHDTPSPGVDAAEESSYAQQSGAGVAKRHQDGDGATRTSTPTFGTMQDSLIRGRRPEVSSNTGQTGAGRTDPSATREVEHVPTRQISAEWPHVVRMWQQAPHHSRDALRRSSVAGEAQPGRISAPPAPCDPPEPSLEVASQPRWIRPARLRTSSVGSAASSVA